jgi:hypothetical protein
MGRALINKTKVLAEENQEMATQLRGGTAAAQVRRRSPDRTVRHSDCLVCKCPLCCCTP